MDQTKDSNHHERPPQARFPRAKFYALFLPIAVLALLAGYMLASQRTDAHINSLLASDSARLNLISGFIAAGVLNSLNQLQTLAGEPLVQQALEVKSPAHLRELENEFLRLMARNPEYQQIRWLDESGMEVVRINRVEGVVQVAPAATLQDKSERYYYKRVADMMPGELYISAVDLNMEQGQVETPHRAVLRIATPLFDAGKSFRGIIVINREMTHVFNLVNFSRTTGTDTDFILVNQDGIVLNGNRVKNRSVLVERDDGAGQILANKQLRELLFSDNSGSLVLDDGLWTWKTLSNVSVFNRLAKVFPEQLLMFDQLNADDFRLTLISHWPLQELMDVRRDNRFIISMMLLFSLAVYGVSLYFYLAGRARTRTAEMEAAYAMARASSLNRMKELEARFHRLVDASSIGQLVVNEAGEIEISNPAAERTLGYQAGELDGVNVDTFLKADKRDAHVRNREQYLKSPESRMMGVGRELEAVRKDGTSVPVEIGLTPYSEKGRTLVLVSIIDLSHRRQI